MGFFFQSCALLLVTQGQDTFIERERAYWQEFLRDANVENIEIPMLAKPRHRGIVMIAGRSREARSSFVYYTLDALLAIASLRRTGCKLPIELWHDGDESLVGASGEQAIHALRDTGELLVRDLRTLPVGSGVVGFQLASLALLYTAFDEVLYLDADVVVVRDPTPLFTSSEFNSTGAVFWPVQIPHLSTMDVVWKVLQCKPWPFMIDNAVMLIHRLRHLTNLVLAHHLNIRWRPLHMQPPLFINGDADMFLFAWLALSAPFHAVTPNADLIGYFSNEHPFCGHTIFMRHPKSPEELVFAHRAKAKFSYIPKSTMRSNAIKRSERGLYQETHATYNSKWPRGCFDFTSEFNGTHVEASELQSKIHRDSIEFHKLHTSGSVDRSPHARESLTTLLGIEEELMDLRSKLTTEDVDLWVLRSKWWLPLAEYCRSPHLDICQKYNCKMPLYRTLA